MGFASTEVREAPRRRRSNIRAPTFDAKLAHIMPQMASMGAAVAVADFDRDGWQDFYVTNSGEGSLNRLYRNKGTARSPTWRPRRLADVNQAGTGVSMGAVWGDFDNDGYEDLFLYKFGRPELFHNDQRAIVRARRRSAPDCRAGSMPTRRSGWTTIAMAGSICSSPATGPRTSISGISRRRRSCRRASSTRRTAAGSTCSTIAATARSRRRLRRSGSQSRRWTLAAAAADLFGTGYPDLFLANDYGISQLFANRRRQARSSTSAATTGVGRTPKSGMNASFGDIFNDGRLSIYKTNISEPGVLVQANDLWVPKSASGSVGGREPSSSRTSLEPGRRSRRLELGRAVRRLEQRRHAGPVSGERLRLGRRAHELLVRLRADRRRAQRASSATPRTGRRCAAGACPGISASASGSTTAPAASPTSRRTSAPPTRYDGRAVALADLRNRGALDVIVANQRGPLLIYTNTVEPGRHWIDVELEGTASNRSAIGARVEVQWNGRRRSRR